MKHSTQRIEFGDFQTPLELAQQCCRVIQNEFGNPHTVIEPTCGQGAFLVAAASQFDCQRIIGYEINEQYRRAARRSLKTIGMGDACSVRKRDFFACQWTRDRQTHDGPVLYIGNPPWVTNSQLGALSSNNLPAKANDGGTRGIDAMTGRSNFDIAESILRSLLDSMRSNEDALAMLVKTATARKLLQHAWNGGHRFSHASIRPIESKRFFDVNVEACLLMLKPSNDSRLTNECLQSSSLTDPADQVAFGYYDGTLVADPATARATDLFQQQRTTSDQRLIWRSGVKHDLSRVVELIRVDGRIENQAGEVVDIESDMVFPLAKGADVANGRTDCQDRRILITQTSLSETTHALAQSHPKTWDYIQRNADSFAARKSSIYRNRDPFALFGIGPYTFAPWKLAICGLYKRLTFSILGPIDAQPVMVDDTCYFLPLQSKAQAEFLHELLSSAVTTDFFNARVFWGAKRPITAQLLRSLDLRALAANLLRSDDFERLFATELAPV